MKEEFAQMISLASYGNEFLRSGRLIKDYFPANIAFRYCNKVDFREDQIQRSISQAICCDQSIMPGDDQFFLGQAG
jgi:hypothetical protein